MAARVIAPTSVKKDEVFEVRILVGHVMENGFRRTEDGFRIPAKLVRTVFCRLVDAIGEREVFRADLSSGVAANPLLQFRLRLQQSGELKFNWSDSDGDSDQAQHRIDVV
jgi:thiosulfate oxidation carrier complex protein SoxZ